MICAVNTGKIDVVKKLLDWGVEVDRRGETDDQTALNICLKNILKVQSKAIISQQMQANPSPEVLEDIRRRSGGLSGNSLDEIKETCRTSKGTSLFKAANKVYLDSMMERIGNLDVENFREIAVLLIKKGASPNAKNNSAIKGYTPLMLAAENNEADLFEGMLRYGGKPDKYYSHPETGQKINCFQIAIAFRSYKVAEILKKKYGFHHQ